MFYQGAVHKGSGHLPKILVQIALITLVTTLAACTNNPYPAADSNRKIFYTAFTSSPRTLDPAVAYSTTDHAVLGNIVDTLLEYHYLKRPYTLIPGLAEKVPEGRRRADGHVSYRFRLRPGLLYQNDPCFSLNGPGATTRSVTAADVAFALARLADPAVNSPVVETFRRLVGFETFAAKLQELRENDPTFSALRADEQYAKAGGIEGAQALGPTELEIVLSEPYPQILYWFAMPFTAPVPWEAVAYYEGKEGRDLLADHPVGAGPFRLSLYRKRSRIVLVRNENWYGIQHPEWKAPGAIYPDSGDAGDAARGLLPPDLVGRPLPFLERIEFRRDAEPIPAFIKFLQGYYDASSIVRESFDRVIHEGALSDDMQRMGMQLEKSVTPAVYYLGFNMDDPAVGSRGGAKARSLRQAMSLAVDANEYMRLFTNGRGVPAQSPLPPGIFGYELEYQNPYRKVNLALARELLRKAGYPKGIDPHTGKPLRLTFDVSDTSARGLLQFQFFVHAWKRLGLHVVLQATNYNQFQEKVRKGAYQIFWWGWVADYPDPENFLFLLYGPMSRTRSNGPNTANFDNARYNELFLRMRARRNDPERLALIRRMKSILERERPWIELFHPEDYVLYHGWVTPLKPPGLPIATTKYYDLDPAMRARLRKQWNQPILWPAYLLAFAASAITLTAVVRARRGR